MSHYRDLNTEQLTTLYDTIAKQRQNLLYEVAALAVEQTEIMQELENKEYPNDIIRPLQLAG